MLIRITGALLWPGMHFSEKLKLFVKGRKEVFEILSSKIKKNERTLWVHCASLGEFEQGVPVISAIKKQFPKIKIVVTFFSPSGYEIKKESSLVDIVTYLPLDTTKNAKRFLDAVRPNLALFVKYEFWPNYLFELKNRNIKTILISGVFRKDQVFFKWYGKFMKNALNCFDHFFVQDENSQKLLKSLGFNNITLAGDTRFDRVLGQTESNNSLAFMEEFKQDSICVVCGSTWPEDEVVLMDSINQASASVKYIIAPHKMDYEKIRSLKNKSKPKTLLYSEIEEKNLSEYSVLIVDTIGFLTKIYSYADIAYVGGAMGTTGLHNILEPATFGVPILIGKNHEKFSEAKELKSLGGLFVVSNSKECTEVLTTLIDNKVLREKTGRICSLYVKDNIGATKKTMDYVSQIL